MASFQAFSCDENIVNESKKRKIEFLEFDEYSKLKGINDKISIKSLKPIINLIKNSTLEKGKSFLIPPKNDNQDPIGLYLKFTSDCRDELSGVKDPWNVSIIELGELAHVFLEKVNQRIDKKDEKTEEDYLIYKRFKKQIEENKDDFTLENFLYLMDCFSIWVTDKNERSLILNYNTGYDKYKSMAASAKGDGESFAWVNFKSYKNIVQKISNHFTEEMCTSSGISKLFPNLVAFPIPFELTIEDILQVFPSKKSNFWPLGFAFDPLIADGARLTPSIFLEHDKQHLAIYRNAMSTFIVEFKKGELSNLLRSDVQKSLLEFFNVGRRLFYESVSICKEICKETEDKDRKIMYSFLSYYLFFETIGHIDFRLGSLYREGYFEQFFNMSSFENENYYLKFLPESTQKLKGSDDFALAINKYSREFLKEFNTRNRHLKEDFEGYLDKQILKNIWLKNVEMFTCALNFGQFEVVNFAYNLSTNSIDNLRLEKEPWPFCEALELPDKEDIENIYPMIRFVYSRDVGLGGESSTGRPDFIEAYFPAEEKTAKEAVLKFEKEANLNAL